MASMRAASARAGAGGDAALDEAAQAGQQSGLDHFSGPMADLPHLIGTEGMMQGVLANVLADRVELALPARKSMANKGRRSASSPPRTAMACQPVPTGAAVKSARRTGSSLPECREAEDSVFLNDERRPSD